MIWIAAAITFATAGLLTVAALNHFAEDRYREWYLAGRADEDQLRELVDVIIDLEGDEALEAIGQIIGQQIAERFPRGPVLTINLNGSEAPAWDGIDRLEYYSSD